MLRGEWEAAWQISDELLRRSLPDDHADGIPPRHLQRIWSGAALSGKRILVRCYHGLGDTIQFIRFAAPLRRIARQVIVWVQPKLIPLLKGVRGVDSLLPLHDGAAQADYEVDIEIMELPHALRVTLDTLPAEVPYLGPAMDWPRLAPPREHPRVGVVWQAGDWNRKRSIPPELIQQLMLGLQDIAWTVLQRGPALQRWPGHCGECPPITGILDEAAELRALDLLISVDTLSAHLAGALGVRTWLLLPARADWRWMSGRDDCPWYPTMRLFRQSHPGEWGPVLAQVRWELAAMTRARPRNARPQGAC